MTTSAFQSLMDTVKKLERKNIWYRLEHIREDAIMIYTCIPGERWEIEFFSDGHIEIERFVSNGGIQEDTSLIEFLLSCYDD